MVKLTRHQIARVMPFVLALASLAVWPASRAGAATPTPTCGTTTTGTSPGGPAYYLFESNGTVVSCGQAPLYGSRVSAKASATIVGGAATPAGGGYWLVTERGVVESFGNAPALGSAPIQHLRSNIVSFAATPDGHGYWMVTTAGNLFHFGDAGFYGSTVRDHRDGTVVALLPTPDAKGYWIVSSTGVVHNYGDAAPVGSLAHRRPPVVAATADPDGRGLVLLTKDGGVHTLGTAGFYGSLVHHHLARPLTAIASSADGAGYLITEATGSIFNFGDAAFEGSLAGAAPRRPTRVVTVAPVTIPQPVVLTAAPVVSSPLLPHGSFGYDISNFQCAKPGSSAVSSSLPASSPFSVIEVAGWLDSSDNSCLAAEAAWASAAAGPGGTPYSLYLFLNAPDQSSGATALDATGPAGQCATLAASAQAACTAYNYGYGGATVAASYASSLGVNAQLWWLDIEGTNLSPTAWSNFSAGQYWSSTTALNDDTIQGAIDALRARSVTVGLYSSSVQYPTIAGSYVPSGAQVPLWIAGAPWTNPPYTESGLLAPAVLAGWCAGTSSYSGTSSDLFAGGVPWLLQETPGTEASPYGIDPDYAC